MNPELAYYVVRYYHNLMTKLELRANRHLIAILKLMHGRDDPIAQQQAIQGRPDLAILSRDPEVIDLCKDGLQAFRARVAARMLEMHGDQVFLNRCPKCNELARTPKARQCRACGFDWHS
ncbi:MAG TPA: hypothetical protein VGS78_16385 [Candidatus Sulfotelmatobacter sp.]|nr:hypothetical protein [Candidatus Sulfotelmatobacter sp.]